MANARKSIERVFLGWDRPALPAVVDWLIERFAPAGEADFGQVIVVVPGRRAGRRLLELLIERSDSRLVPPEIITQGELPELLYRAKRPFADELVQHLAWVQALRQLGPAALRDVVPDPPAADNAAGWLLLGELLAKQHTELAADGLDFADVARRGGEVEHFDEAHRWKALRKVQQEYLSILDALELWDRQTARLFAIEHNECRSDRRIVLVGTADMNTSMRQMLDRVAEQVTAIVHAPEALADRFDEHGCLVPTRWADAPIEIRPEQVHVVDGPAEQADAVARTIADYGGRRRADEITIGMTDDGLVPHVERQLAQCGISTRWVVGRRLPETAPVRLIAAVAEYLDGRSYSAFAALVRHPDVDRWLMGRVPGGWLTSLDAYYADHLPRTLGAWVEGARHAERVKETFDVIAGWLQVLDDKPRPLGDWTEPLQALLTDVYDGREFDPENWVDKDVLAACEAIQVVLLEHTAVPESLAPQMTATEAIRLTLRELASKEIPPPHDDEAIELLGWLELPLDDAPALVVTTFNEGYVPSSVNADSFLPNALRARLGVTDNARRYARDAYALSVLLASRDNLSLIVARRDVHGDPLAPSRLLFAAEPQQVAERVLAFYRADGPPASLAPLAGVLAAARETTGLCVPQPPNGQAPPERMNVTSFRTYLSCPYRFYLRHVLRLGALDDASRELDPPGFGTLVHEVLKLFGRDESIRGSTDAGSIRRFLYRALDGYAKEVFGEQRPAPLNVQLELVRARFDAFAEWQARWAADGWAIQHTEVPGRETPVVFPLGGERCILLDGRIDRIDYNARLGEWVIFDYKTSESAADPAKSHYARGEWIDLQLPLYRHLARPLGVDGRVELGYIALPRNLEDVGHRLAGWSDHELREADTVAQDIVRRVLNQEFWPLRDVRDNWFDELAGICQDGVFDREVP
ncbi:MAG: PD-(D/E)XK nuclease family protein, partial [Planctomycetes bacterium]|nr:PD-(D/E)XK nuclease family protein [Planctomycetota bacterium]